MHIINEGIADHEHVARGRHARNFEQFQKKLPRWLPETAFRGHYKRLKVLLPTVSSEQAPGPVADVIRRQYQSMSSACLFEKGLSIIKWWTALDPYVGKSL